MTALAHPALQTALDEALAATGARCGILTVATPEGLSVAATSGAVAPGLVVGATMPTRGARGYVLASGQPTVLRPDRSDASNIGLGGVVGVPVELLVVPGPDTVIVELADRADGPFTFDHIEVVVPLVAVADAAATSGATSDEVATPARLGAQLGALASTDPARYREVARVIESLLSLSR